MAIFDRIGILRSLKDYSTLTFEEVFYYLLQVYKQLDHDVSLLFELGQMQKVLL